MVTVGPKKGQEVMRAKQTAAEKLFWPLQAGRSKNHRPGALESVLIARTQADVLAERAINAGLLPGDTKVCLVYSTGDYAVLDLENPDSTDLLILRDIVTMKLRPVGILFMLLDRAKKNLLAHARPFERTDEDIKILSDALDGIEGKFNEQV